MIQNNIPKNIDEFIEYMEVNYGIKFLSYQKEFLKMMWEKESIKEYLFMPRHSDISTDHLIYIYKILLGDKN